MKVRPGLIVTLTICALMVMFRDKAADAAMLTLIALRWPECPMQGTYRHMRAQRQAMAAIKGDTRLLESDAQYRLYDYHGEKLWVPANSHYTDRSVAE
jgi:hypothetical protein